VPSSPSAIKKGDGIIKKTRFSAVLSLLLLAGLVVAMGVAGDEPEEVVITVWNGGVYDIDTGDTVVIRAGWGACNPGLVRMFVNAVNFEVTLDDTIILTPEDVDDLWGKVTRYDPQPDWPECVGGGPRAYAEWRSELPMLEPGSYELRTRWWLEHPIIDGGDYDGDGRPDQSRPGDWGNDSLITIHVSDG
jgi:hypothetical protein